MGSGRCAAAEGGVHAGGRRTLLMTMMSFCTPRVLARSACSRVWPPRSYPVSNSPLRADMTSTPMSACDAPWIMLGTKFLWPGASRMVYLHAPRPHPGPPLRRATISRRP